MSVPKFTKFLLVVLPACWLSACGWLFGDNGVFRDRGDDYRLARSVPRIKVPGGLNDNALQDLYPVPPDQSDTLLAGEFEVPRPEPLRAAEAESGIRIQRLGDEQWILAESTPGEIWPQVRNFLLSNRLGIENEDVVAGTMETAWLSSDERSDVREKFRYRVEQGIQRRSAELYVKQISFPATAEALPVTPEWPEASLDKARETWMVKELASWLASMGDESSVSLMAQGLSTVSKMYMVRDDSGRRVIDLRLPYERAWASLGRALERGEFNVTDLDREAGRYYALYEPEPDEKPGFFKRLFGHGKNDDNPVAGIEFVIDVNKIESGVLIGIAREDAQPLEEETTDLLLSIIRGNLS